MSFRYTDGRAADHVNLSEQLATFDPVNSFGADADGELYLLLSGGTIVKIVREP
jgi:hypothetical protein